MNIFAYDTQILFFCTYPTWQNFLKLADTLFSIFFSYRLVTLLSKSRMSHPMCMDNYFLSRYLVFLLLQEVHFLWVTLLSTRGLQFFPTFFTPEGEGALANFILLKWYSLIFPEKWNFTFSVDQFVYFYTNLILVNMIKEKIPSRKINFFDAPQRWIWISDSLVCLFSFAFI